MDILLFILGFVLFILGLAYFFQPKLVMRFNAVVRDTFFKDSVALLSHRRVGVILVLLSLILLTFSKRMSH